MKRLLFWIKFWFIDVPLWIPQRIYWYLKRRKCVKKGCQVEILRNEKTQKIEYRYCIRCGAYKGKRRDDSNYTLIEITTHET